MCICQDYTEEFRDIAKGKSKDSIPAGSITLINQRPVGEDLTVMYLFVFVLHANISLTFYELNFRYT